MKKFLVLALALTFVLSMSIFAFADDGGQDSIRSMAAGSNVLIGGDARVRGTWKSNYNMNDDEDADVRNWDQRVRLKLDANVGSGIEVRTRFSTDNQQWDGTNQTNSNLATDYAYLHIPVQGIVIDAGRLKRSWGNKLLIWDQSRDSFQITTNLGDTQLGLYTDKVDDSSVDANGDEDANAGGENLEDHDNYGIFANYSAGNLTAGLHIIREEDNTGNTDANGTEASAYLNTSVGAISIAAEIAYKGGDINEIENEDPTAGFIYAATDIGAINVNGFVAMLKNGFVADNHLTPTVFFGTDNPTAIADVQAASDSTTMAIVIGAGTDLSSDLSVSAKIGYFDLENLGAELGGTDTGHEDVTEIDLGLAYKLADNAVYKVDFGYMMPDKITTKDDAAMALAHKVEVSF